MNNPNFGRLRDERGFSLAGALATVMVLGVVAAGTASLFGSTNAHQRSLMQKMDVSALTANLLLIMTNQGLCNSQLANPLNTVGNSVMVDVSDPAMATGAPSPSVIQYNALAIGTLGTAIVAQVGQPLPGSTSGLTVSRIQLNNIVYSGQGSEYVGTLTIDWTENSQSTKLRPITMTQVFTVTGPPATANIVSCGVQVSSRMEYFIAREEYPSGTPPPLYSPANSHIVRRLNTVDPTSNIAGASLDPATGVFTLPAGTYFISASGAAYQVTDHVMRLVREPNTDMLIGTLAFAQLEGANPAGYTFAATSHSVIQGVFVLSATAQLRLVHVAAEPGYFGRTANFGVPEVYSYVSLRKY